MLGGLLSYSHGYDDDDNLTVRLDNLDAANHRSFGYDEVHRLKNASGPWGAGTGCTLLATYEYDLTGNRTCKGEGAASTTYTYTTGSNHLSSAMGAESATYFHDMGGNITGDGVHTYDFDDTDRLASVDAGATAAYTYDGEGRRAIKVAGAKTTYYFYHPSGRLLTETVFADESGKDYIYLDETPFARVDWAAQELSLGDVLTATDSPPNVHLDWSAFPGGSNRYVVRRKQIVDFSDKTFDGNVVIATPPDPTRTHDDPVLSDTNTYFYRVFRRVLNDTLYFYHTDHLGTPIAMTDSGGGLVWRAEHVPFGGLHSLPVSAVTNNLRLPGQYFDSETGLHQNWFRDYDSGIGRYREPDPLGLAGGDSSSLTPAPVGVNVYSYAEQNPVVKLDPLGLAVVTVGCNAPQAAAIQGGAAQSDAASQTCLPCQSRQTFRTAVRARNITFECFPSNTFVPGTPVRCAGAFTDRGTGDYVIRITPFGFANQSPQDCGCLKSQILHEVLHIIAFGGNSESQIRRQTRRCFSCAKTP